MANLKVIMTQTKRGVVVEREDAPFLGSIVRIDTSYIVM